MRTLVALGVLAVLTALMGRNWGLHSPLFIGSELTLLVTILAISRLVLPLVDRRDRGATGEERVGEVLDELTDSGWRVIHDASFGHGNVDHIVFGPAGVFTVETKSHPGPVRVQSIHGATYRQAQLQREALERITGERVEPLIVFSRAWVDKPLIRRRGVRVMPATMLPGYLKRRRQSLTSEEVEEAHRQVVAVLAEVPPAPDRRLGWPPLSRNHSQTKPSPRGSDLPGATTGARSHPER